MKTILKAFVFSLFFAVSTLALPAGSGTFQTFPTYPTPGPLPLPSRSEISIMTAALIWPQS